MTSGCSGAREGLGPGLLEAARSLQRDVEGGDEEGGDSGGGPTGGAWGLGLWALAAVAWAARRRQR